MIFVIDASSGTVGLEDRDAFDSLKAVVSGGGCDRAVDLLGAAAEPDDHAWVPAPTIEAMAAPASPEWTSSFRAMLAKVEPFGWYRSASDEVKVHIECRPG